MDDEESAPVQITPQKLFETIDHARDLTNIDRFTLAGSGSIIAFMHQRYHDLPEFMTKTRDLDISSRFNGQSVEIYNLEMNALKIIGREMGAESDFKTKNKIYVEFVNRNLPDASPEGWEERAKEVLTPKGTSILALHPLDCATLKANVCREKDVEWIANGLASDIFTASALKKHMVGHKNYDKEKATSSLAKAEALAKLLEKENGRE